MKAILLACFMASATALAQDGGVAAGIQMQQDMLSAGNATLQAGQQMNDFNQAVTQQMIIAGQSAQQFLPPPPWKDWRIASPHYLRLSVKSGQVKPGQKVSIRWRGSDYIGVYYTTDGQPPTITSTRYTGPIPITRQTHLQVVGIEWPGLRGRWTHTSILDASYDPVPPPKTP